MREIIHLQTGQGGNHIGLKFWEDITKEHSIDCTSGLYTGNDHDLSSQQECLKAYYNETSSKTYVPRAIIVDLDPDTMDHIKSSKMAKLFNSENFIFGEKTAGNNWAKGHYTNGAKLVDSVLNVIRREVEHCGNFSGFQMAHSLGGGTGSGMGTLILNKIKEEYPDKIVSTFSIMPSAKVSDTVVEPYNATLSIHQLINGCDESFCFDNEALFDKCLNILEIPKPTYGDLNHLVSQTMSGVTSCFRFHGQLNSELRKITINKAPPSRLRFFMTGLVPLTKSESVEKSKNNLELSDFTKKMFEANNMLMACDPRDGRYLEFSAICRGNDEMFFSDIDKEILKFRNLINSHGSNYWLPPNIKTGVCHNETWGLEKSVTCMANSTAIHKVFNRISEQFNRMFKRKAFLHWYYDEGMTEMEFSDAINDLNDLMDEYKKCETETLN